MANYIWDKWNSAAKNKPSGRDRLGPATRARGTQDGVDASSSLSTKGNRDFPGDSLLLTYESFRGLLKRHVPPDEQILDTTDGMVEIWSAASGRMKLHRDVAIVLTVKRLVIFRKQGLAGVKGPFALDLTDVEEVALTRQSNVSIKWTGEYRESDWWKLHLNGGKPTAEHWVSEIHQAVVRALEPERTRTSVVPYAARPFPEIRPRLQIVLDGLAPLALPSEVGAPFGEGAGLESAAALITRTMLDEDDIRQAGTMMALDIIGAGDRVGPDRLNEVMGCNSSSSNSLDADTIAAASQLAGAAKTFLGQFDEDGEVIWELWKRNREVAIEFLCWFSIARLRLATIKVLEPAVYPE